MRNILLAVLLLAATACVNVQATVGHDRMHPRFQPTKSGRVDYASEEELEALYWMNEAQSTLTNVLARQQITSPAKNVIMFLGDGMSVPTVTAARILLGQTQGNTGEEAQLSFDQFPYAGLSRTYCVDTQTADSACSATAYLCGVKTNYGTIGVTAAVPRGDCQGQNDTSLHVNSIARWAQDAGKATGVVTTARITHASPAGTYAHIAERDWECDADIVAEGQDPAVCPDIALQLVTWDTGRNIRVLMGGGREKFIPEGEADEAGTQGERLDGRNLADEWLADKQAQGNATYVWTLEQLNSIDPDNTDYVLGLFADDHMDYHLDADEAVQPRLVDMTRVAIQTLQKEPNGYFLFVEGARIDMGHHSNLAHKALDEALEFSEAIQAAVDLTDEQDTLIVVTADHAHTMSVSGYPERGNNIFGIVDLDDNGNTRMTLNYANGPSYEENRIISDTDDTDDKDFEFPSQQLLSSETHGADDVAIMSRGPWAHLLTGVFQQNYIPHAMAYASCVGDGLSACDRTTTSSGHSVVGTSPLAAVATMLYAARHLP